MKTIVTTIVSLCLVLGGCANTHSYSRDGTNSEVTHADMQICRGVMARLSGDDAKDAFDKCMADKGYEKTVNEYHL